MDAKLVAQRRTSDLLIGRRSVPHATYFLTICEAHRRQWLANSAIASELKRALDELHAQGDLLLLCATVMPDHVHVLGTLGQRLSLSRIVAKLKARTRSILRERQMVWQENFYEHRLRDPNEIEPFFRYIFLNPYRASLLDRSQRWPYWWRWGELRFQLEEMLASDAIVPAEWLDLPGPAGAAD